MAATEITAKRMNMTEIIKMDNMKKHLDGELGDVKVSIPSVVTDRQLQNDLGLGTTKASIEVVLDDEYPAIFSLLYKETLHDERMTKLSLSVHY